MTVSFIFPDRTKQCPRCQRVLPWSEFNPRKRTDTEVLTVRSPCRKCSNENKRQHKRSEEVAGLLPVEPFRAWLDRKALRFEDEESFADYLGVPSRAIYRWRNEVKTVRLDVVDSLFCRLGDPCLLRELWPELYEFPEEVAA